ncbi:regulator [Lactobacillus acidophilus]|nr:regulator [Lactobacillus acidophilus]
MDIRIVNTKNRVQSGLIVAINSMPLYKIKDKDIIQKAQVSSSSYYKYYSDKSEVLRDLENSLFSEFRIALSMDSKNWGTVNHAPSKKDISRLIDSNINELINYFNKHKDMLQSLISENGDPGFKNQIIDVTTNTVKKLIIYYFHLYNQEYILKKDKLKLTLLARRYALSFLGPLFAWLEYTDEMTLKETKKLMKQMILNSPYDISTHGF